MRWSIWESMTGTDESAWKQIASNGYGYPNGEKLISLPSIKNYNKLSGNEARELTEQEVIEYLKDNIVDIL